MSWALRSIRQEVNIRGYKPNTSVHIGQLKRAVKLLNHAKRPLFLAGGGVNIAESQRGVYTAGGKDEDPGGDDRYGKRGGADESSVLRG